MKEADLDTMLIRYQGYSEVRQAFRQNPSLELILMCDEKAKEIRINAVNKETNNDMRYYGEKVFMKAGQIASFPVKELMR